jgi:regulator of sigma D
MMEPKRLRDRVSKLESEMGEVRGAANRAAAEATHAHVRLDAQTQLMMALRDTQVEDGKRMREGFAAVRSEMRDGFAKVAVGQQLITQLLTDRINSCERPDEG